jgi:2-polyprenyl-3-methyl-5-hydroxy-6-metoxy-1,4-benzoquinol methylase
LKNVTEPGKHYETTYGSFANKVQQDVRREAFGEDIGQNSWLTADEFRGFFNHLQLTSTSKVLDVACGSGGPALYMARTLGCHITGIDISENGVATGSEMAREQKLDSLAVFLQADAAGPLQFASELFDVVLCIDALNHLRSRAQVLGEWYRVLKPGGRLLFTDPTTVTGLISNEEVAIRSSIGYFTFAPVGADERLIKASGFELLLKEDATENVAQVSKRRHDARHKRKEDLITIEGEETFDGTQRFLYMVYTLASERRLSRFVFLARK